MSVKLIAYTRITKQSLPLLTVEIEMPKFIQAQFNTHRALNRNSQSSRAVPVSKTLKTVPSYVPQEVGFNNKGMVCKDYLDTEQLTWFQERWRNLERLIELEVKNINTDCKELFGKTIEKGIINRPLDPFRMVRVVATGVVDSKGWYNFLKQRAHIDAQADIRKIAFIIEEMVKNIEPTIGDRHLPYALPEQSPAQQVKYSVVSCAAISYRNTIDPYDSETINRIYEKLLSSDPVHWSPFEHQGFNLSMVVPGDPAFHSNFAGSGYTQLRKMKQNFKTDTTELIKQLDNM